MTLIYHGRLPSGALVNQLLLPHSVHRGVGSAPVWLSADSDEFDLSAEDSARVIRWRDSEAGLAAERVGPNSLGTQLEPGPPAALIFTSGVNSGLVLSGAIAEATKASFGAVFIPKDGNAETLMTFQPRGSRDYLYVAERLGVVRVEQNSGDFCLAQKLNQRFGAILVLCSLEGAKVSISINAAPPLTRSLGSSDFNGPADLFIGCRGQRPGLKRKLGSFLLTDVFVWSGEGLLGDAAGAAAEVWRGRTYGA